MMLSVCAAALAAALCLRAPATATASMPVPVPVASSSAAAAPPPRLVVYYETGLLPWSETNAAARVMKEAASCAYLVASMAKKNGFGVCVFFKEPNTHKTSTCHQILFNCLL